MHMSIANLERAYDVQRHTTTKAQRPEEKKTKRYNVPRAPTGPVGKQNWDWFSMNVFAAHVFLGLGLTIEARVFVSGKFNFNHASCPVQMLAKTELP